MNSQFLKISRHSKKYTSNLYSTIVKNVKVIDEIDANFRRSRVFLITSNDENSNYLYEKLNIYLQKSGCQPVRYTLKSIFPSAKDISEGVSLAKRTGISSIIGVGTEAVTDVSKAIREDLEGRQSKLALPTQNNDFLRNTYPLLLLPSTQSPSPIFPVYKCLHEEEDILLSHSCARPETVAFVMELLQDASSLQPTSDMSTSYMIAHLFDLLFCRALVDLADGQSSDVVKQSLKILLQTESITARFLNIIESPSDLANVGLFLRCLGNLRETLCARTPELSHSWCGPIDAGLTLLVCAKPQVAKVVPLSWLSTGVLHAYMTNTSSAGGADSVTDSDITSSPSHSSAIYQTSSKIVLEVVEEATGLAPQTLLEHISKALMQIADKIKKVMPATAKEALEAQKLQALLDEMISCELEIMSARSKVFDFAGLRPAVLNLRHELLQSAFLDTFLKAIADSTHLK